MTSELANVLTICEQYARWLRLAALKRAESGTGRSRHGYTGLDCRRMRRDAEAFERFAAIADRPPMYAFADWLEQQP